MYGRILVPTDGSPGVERAVEHAIELADVHGATLHAVYVVNTASLATLPMETSWEGVGAMLREDGEEALGRVREIVRFAEECDVDAIVMGTHGRGGIDRLLLGSVAERVVRAAEVPVTTVRVGEVEEDQPGTDEAESATEDAENHV